jgi:DNA invertase Pin-like site-specific DNA recombinase
MLNKQFEDKASGKSTDARPQLAACLDYCREGDTLHVHSFDRLARNLVDLRSIVTQLTDKGVAVHFCTESLTFTGDTANPMADLMLNLLGSVAQFERALILERQRFGIAAAKASGKYKGSLPKLSPEKAAELRARVATGVPKAAVAREFGISRETLYGYLRAA